MASRTKAYKTTADSLANQDRGGVRRDRDLAPLARQQYDLIIIGGGITGATVLWDATLRGMKALLLEKNDYASGTTQATSKLIHGGLRYLRSYEFGLVRESLRERRTLARIAPHAVRPEGFLMPLYKHFGHKRSTIALALWIYDALGFDRNRELPVESQLPRHIYLNRSSTLAEEPVLRSDGLTGSYVYYDFANLNPERLCCEFIFSARERGAAARNYVEVDGVRRKNAGFEVRGRDVLTGQSAKFTARTVLNAAGPWADFLVRDALQNGNVPATQAGANGDGAAGRRLIRSKGIHVITRKIARDKALALTLTGKRKQHFFVLPWRNKSIIGTTDTAFHAHPDELQVTPEEIDGLIDNVNQVTRANLSRVDVEYYYAGLRPLVDEDGDKHADEAGDGSGTYEASRRTEIVHHADTGLPGFFTALGGKYTTSRALAEKIVNQLAEYLPGSFAPCATARTALGGEYASLNAVENALMQEFPDTPFPMIQTLAGRYGEQARDILARGPVGGGERWRMHTGEDFYAEEIDFLVQNDEIQHLSDLYLRRAGLGTTGLPPETVNRQIAERLGKHLGWNRSDLTREIKTLEERYRF